MRYLLLLTIVLASLGNTQAQSSSSKSYPFLDPLLEALRQETQLPGIAISVNYGGKLLYSKGFGYWDLEEKTPMEATSVIRTGSVAKILTATALGRLVTKGRLDLDRPIGDYVSFLDAPYAQLTCRQIAGHTAGVVHRPSKNGVKAKHYAEIRPTVDFLQKEALLFPPDNQYAYSTLGYNLLAAVIESVTGQPYANYMRDSIFVPLGMLQTEPDNQEEALPMYFFKKGQIKKDRRPVDGSYKLAGAAFRSTAQDLALLMNAYHNGFIAKEVVQDMWTNRHLVDGTLTNVGLGWRINRDFTGAFTVDHAGSWQGARTVVVHYPEEQLTVSVMINTKCELFIEETAQLIARSILDADQPLADLEPIIGNYTMQDRRKEEATSFEADIKRVDTTIAQLKTNSTSDWLRESPIFSFPGEGRYALISKYGLLYLEFKQEANPPLNLFLYQNVRGPFHPESGAMLEFGRE
ncbi:MAG: serine hydrolase domain-containing protein [Bacteroidota bacterium]